MNNSTFIFKYEDGHFDTNFRLNNVDYEKDNVTGRCYFLDTSRVFNSRVAREGGFVKRRISKVEYEKALVQVKEKGVVQL